MDLRVCLDLLGFGHFRYLVNGTSVSIVICRPTLETVSILLPVITCLHIVPLEGSSRILVTLLLSLKVLVNGTSVSMVVIRPTLKTVATLLPVVVCLLGVPLEGSSQILVTLLSLKVLITPPSALLVALESHIFVPQRIGIFPMRGSMIPSL